MLFHACFVYIYLRPFVPEDKHENWIDYAVKHTVNISTQNGYVSWLMGFLNCQVKCDCIYRFY